LIRSSGSLDVYEGVPKRLDDHDNEERTQVGALDKDLHRPRLCAAIVDRLTFNGQIIETGTTSYRLARARPSEPLVEAMTRADRSRRRGAPMGN